MTTKPQSTTEETLHSIICGVVHRHCKDVQLPFGTNGLESDLIKALNSRISPASAAPVVDRSEFINRTELLTSLDVKMQTCIRNAQDTSKPAKYRLMMEHFAEAGRQIIEFIDESGPSELDSPVSRKSLRESIEFVLQNWRHSTSDTVRELLKVVTENTAAATAAPRSNYFPNEVLNKGFPDHISRDGTAYYSDGTVLPPTAAPVEQSESKHCRTCHCEPCDQHEYKETGRGRYRCIRCHSERFAVGEEELGYPSFTSKDDVPLG